MPKEIIRCPWAEKNNLDRAYHDHVRGKPIYEDEALFRLLMLESQQAGLSWSTILAKMDGLCKAYDNFVPGILQHYDEAKIASLLQNPEVIRNKLKIQSVVHNAKAYLQHFPNKGSFSNFLWTYVEHTPLINHWTSINEVPVSTPLSDNISKALKNLGFKFVGSTTVYAFLQAAGLINDHLIDCSFRFRE